MKHIIRLFILIAALVLGTDHAWADTDSNPRVNFVYVDGNNYALNSEKGFAIASDADQTGQVTITVTINEGQDFRCIEDDLTAEQSINSGNAEARTRTSGEGLGKGVPVPVKFVETNKFTLTLPEDESTNVTVYVKFSEKLEFNPEVTIEDWPYGETANEPSLKANPSSDDVTYTYANAEEGTYTETVPTQAGPHWVKASVAATADYKACESQPVSFTIAKAPLTIKAKDHGILYGNAAANNGVEYSGFVNNEDESVLGGELTYTYSYDANNDNHKPGIYEITPSGLTSNNYAITFVPGTLTVTSVPVKVSVVDKADGKPIVGNQVVVRNSNGVIIHDWRSTSTEENHEISVLKAGGEYTIMGNAFMGYTRSAEYTLTIGENGNVSSYSGTITQDGVLLVENSKTHVNISVVDKVTRAALGGARVQVKDSKGAPVDEWDSGTENNEINHIIECLTIGEVYTLRETVAPDGYTIPAANTFTIAEDGKVTYNGTTTQDGVLLVENTKTHVEVSVVDVANGEEIEGATIQVIDPDNKVVEEWTSTKNNYVIEGLKTGEEYTLRETVAPDGYVLSTDNTFTIDEAGGVTSTGLKTTDDEGNTVLLVENTKTHVEISVVDIANGESLEGAHVQVIGQTGVVDEWISDGSTHIIEGLKAGTEYTLRETQAPNRYAAPADYKFTIAPNGSITFTGNKTNEGVLLVENIELIDVSVAIVWVDENNQKGFRPENVNVKLFANGAEVEGKTATLRANNEWKYTWTRLNKFADGQEITYTVSQDQLGYYEVPVIEKASETGWSYTVSNSLINEQAVTEVTVSIVWEDNNNGAGARPESVTVFLGGGNNSQLLELSANNNWTYTCENLPKYENGVAIDYTVTTLNPISDYSTQITKASDGTFTYTITNKYAPIEKTDICVTIVWEDNNNQSGFRPENVNVKLLADDVEVEGVETATLNADNEWKYTWTGLNKFADDKEIIYTVSQDQLNGYMNPVIEKVSESEWEYKVTNSIISISGVTITKDGNGVTATLNGASDESFSITGDINIDHVKLNRKFESDKKVAICWPFAVDNTKAASLGKFYQFAGISTEGKITMQEVTGGLEANTPYIFEPSADITTIIDFGENTLKAGGPLSVGSGFTFKGIYDRVKWTTDESDPLYDATRAAELGKAYGFALEEIKVGSTKYLKGQFVKLGSGAHSRPFRAYMLYDGDWDGNQPSASARNRSEAQSLPDVIDIVWISANDEATGIEDINRETTNCSDWYSLDGRKLNGKPTVKGLYINNGRKVVIQ